MDCSEVQNEVVAKLQDVLVVRRGYELGLEGVVHDYLQLLHRYLFTNVSYLKMVSNSEFSKMEHIAWFDDVPVVEDKNLADALQRFVERKPFVRGPHVGWMQFMPALDQRWDFVNNFSSDGFGLAYVLFVLSSNLRMDAPGNIRESLGTSLRLLKYGMTSVVEQDAVFVNTNLVSPAIQQSYSGMRSRPTSYASFFPFHEDGSYRPMYGHHEARSSTRGTVGSRHGTPSVDSHHRPSSSMSLRSGQDGAHQLFVTVDNTSPENIVRADGIVSGNRSGAVRSFSILAESSRDLDDERDPSRSTNGMRNSLATVVHALEDKEVSKNDDGQGVQPVVVADDDQSGMKNVDINDEHSKSGESINMDFSPVASSAGKRKKFYTTPSPKKKRKADKMDQMEELEVRWAETDLEKEYMNRLKLFNAKWKDNGNKHFPAEFRPFFIPGFYNSGRQFDKCPKLKTKSEVIKFAISIAQWIFSIAPPSCVEGRELPKALPYIPLTRISADRGNHQDRKAWKLLFNGGKNGPFMFGLCLWIWKGEHRERFFSTEGDYDNVLSDVRWIIEEGIRVPPFGG
ncbi:hypothetical protein SCHPADRAFT_891180 [Schizopora paradoxa]|uniref:Uncharacterized protein n=1 Tax=Schizopora paradoxa TaxID=27342 RepID=A0A0H2RJF8_9AGAM|nr:hypothetical protein SCHPADRAFT_891180 [Schizopora paradoxa]